MKSRSLLAASLLTALLGGCSVDSPIASGKSMRDTAATHGTTGTTGTTGTIGTIGTIGAGALPIDPAIPALTIVAHRMNDSEKKAYDHETQTTVASITPVSAAPGNH